MVMQVISPKYLPTQLPISTGVLLWLIMDRLDTPVWGQAVLYTLYCVWFLLAVCLRWNETWTSPDKIKMRGEKV